MKFAEIIREAGLNPSEFKKCSDIPAVLYDGKDRVESKETVHYIEPLFEKNPGSLWNFKSTLISLENENIESINVKVDIDSVVLFYKTGRATVFSRRKGVYIPNNME